MLVLAGIQSAPGFPSLYLLLSLLSYSVPFSSLPHLPQSCLLLPTLLLSATGIIWSVCGFCGRWESSAEALFLQCPRRQYSGGVLTAESSHNAKAFRVFELHRQEESASTPVHWPGRLHLLELLTSYGNKKIEVGERRLELLDVCEFRRSGMCYDVHELNPFLFLPIIYLFVSFSRQTTLCGYTTVSHLATSFLLTKMKACFVFELSTLSQCS